MTLAYYKKAYVFLEDVSYVHFPSLVLGRESLKSSSRNICSIEAIKFGCVAKRDIIGYTCLQVAEQLHAYTQVQAELALLEGF